MSYISVKHHTSLKKCPSCGKLFACKGDEDCWCENYQILNKNYYRLMLDHNDCVCENCLKSYAE